MGLWSKKPEPAPTPMLEMMGVIDLQPFCADEDSVREYLQRPFTFGEFTYATNGHICVRVPKRAGVAEGEVITQEKVETLFAGTVDRTVAPLPLYETLPAKIETCGSCKGSGVEKHCGCPEDDECAECGDTGWVAAAKGEPNSSTCEGCEGDGTIEEVTARARFASHDYNLAYLNLIVGLPGLEVAFGSRPADGLRKREWVTEHAMAFRFDGGCGLLMPLVRTPTETAGPDAV